MKERERGENDMSLEERLQNWTRDAKELEVHVQVSFDNNKNKEISNSLSD